jgi:hypothetical protein
MDILITLIIFVAGFIAGALVFRNNAAKSEQIVKDALELAAKAEAEAKELTAKVKKTRKRTSTKK